MIDEMGQRNLSHLLVKWDNAKRICEEIKELGVSRRAYNAGMWGISTYIKDQIASKN